MQYLSGERRAAKPWAASSVGSSLALPPALLAARISRSWLWRIFEQNKDCSQSMKRLNRYRGEGSFVERRARWQILFTSLYQAKQRTKSFWNYKTVHLFILFVTSMYIINWKSILQFTFSLSVIYIFWDNLNVTFFHLQNNLIAGTTYRIRCWLWTKKRKKVIILFLLHLNLSNCFVESILRFITFSSFSLWNAKVANKI